MGTNSVMSPTINLCGKQTWMASALSIQFSHGLTGLQTVLSGIWWVCPEDATRQGRQWQTTWWFDVGHTSDSIRCWSYRWAAETCRWRVLKIEGWYRMTDRPNYCRGTDASVAKLHLSNPISREESLRDQYHGAKQYGRHTFHPGFNKVNAWPAHRDTSWPVISTAPSQKLMTRLLNIYLTAL